MNFSRPASHGFVVVLLVACGTSSTPAPNPTPAPPPPSRVEAASPETPSLAGLDAAAQCKATEPRALPCMDQLFAAFYRATMGFDLDEKTANQHSDDQEARAIHMANCLGDRDFTYMQNIVACWNEPGCDAFAACVGKRTPSLVK